MTSINLLALIALCFIFQTSVIPQNFCSVDTRVFSQNPAVGRLINYVNGEATPVGTAWIAPNGKLVTAWHHPGYDATYVQFNIYNTQPNPNPLDVYEIIPSSWIHPTLPGQTGNDWAVFEVYPNEVEPNVFQTPIQRQQAYLKITQDVNPLDIITVSATGHGIYSGSTPNRLQKSALGPQYGYLDEFQYIKYRASVNFGSSGSPIIDEATGYAIGVTNGIVCGELDVDQFAFGTTIFNSAFWNALGLEKNIFVDQKREDNSRMINSNIGRWKRFYHSFENSTITNPNQPIEFTMVQGDDEVLRGDQNLVQNPDEKYHRWLIDFIDESDIKKPSQIFNNFRFNKSNITLQKNLHRHHNQ